MKIQNPAHLSTVTDLHDVPTADVVDNAHMRDVVGNKGDAQDTSYVGATTSLMARIKGCLGGLTATTADSASFSHIKHTIGHKQDAEIELVGTSFSLVAYLKGLVREMNQRAVPHMAMAYSQVVGFVDLVNITDKGVLTGVYVAVHAVGRCHIRIIIDGTTIINTPVLRANLNQAMGIPFNHRFNTSLQVSFHAEVGGQEVECGATWTTD